MSVCTSCGTANPGENKFCRSCGVPLAAAPAVPKAAENVVAAASGEVTKCPSCGQAIQPGNKFCLSCGTALARPSAQLMESQPQRQAATMAAAASGLVASGGPTNGSQEVAPAAAPVEPLPARESVTVAEPAPEAQPSRGVDAAKSPAELCTTCGAALVSGQKFCLACGTAAGQAMKTGTSAPPLPAPAPVAAAPSTTIQPLQEGPFQKPPRSGVGTIVLVIVLLVLMGGAGWFVWKYFSRPDVTVTAFQQRIHVAVGGKTTLVAGVSGASDTDVVWSIQEGDKGGQIIALGAQMDGNQPRSAATYTAPADGGTFHVIATSHANPSRSASVEIVVGSASQPQAVSSPATAPPPAGGVDANAAPILGTWRWPSGEKLTIGPDSTVAVTSDTDPSKNLQGTYRSSDKSHFQIDFGHGDVRTWEILGVDSNYLRVLSQSKTDASPTAIVFVRIAN